MALVPNGKMGRHRKAPGRHQVTYGMVIGLLISHFVVVVIVDIVDTAVVVVVAFVDSKCCS